MKALDRLRGQPRVARRAGLAAAAGRQGGAAGGPAAPDGQLDLGRADEIVVKDYVNLGIAAATQRGLIVPNIKDAGRLSLRELADALTRPGRDGQGRAGPRRRT